MDGTYCGQRRNQGELSPMALHENEGFASLRCGGTTVLLSYTALHLIHGWLVLGSNGYSFTSASREITQSFAAITAEAAEGMTPQQ
jgi:hypothetical protein